MLAFFSFSSHYSPIAWIPFYARYRHRSQNNTVYNECNRIEKIATSGKEPEATCQARDSKAYGAGHQLRFSRQRNHPLAKLPGERGRRILIWQRWFATRWQYLLHYAPRPSTSACPVYPANSKLAVRVFLFLFFINSSTITNVYTACSMYHT